MKPVRKAIFPVAGFGTRFLPATKAVPKEMLRDQAYAAWQDQHPRILTESSRLIALMLRGAQLGGRRQGAQPP